VKISVTLIAFGVLLAVGAAAHEPAALTTPDYGKALAASQAAAGRGIGDYALTDPDRRSVALSDFRGKPLLVSFVYTGCIDVCPTTTRYLARAIAAARAALGPESFNVVTIGFNQPFDSPEAMGAFARQNGIRDPFWRFLSADAETTAAIARDLGFTWYATPKGFDHIAQLSVVDASGVVYRQVYGETFELPLLVGPLKELMSGQAGRAGFAGVWDKVKLFCTVYDPNSGGYRLNYSLFIEIFAGSTVLAGLAWFLLREYRRRPG
jgi:protein SCO1